MEATDAVVVGGGVSGVSLAHFLNRQGKKTLLIEKDNRAGGSFESAQRDDFWLELGAHTCYNSYGGFISVIEDCGFSDALVPREKVPFRFYHQGQVVSFGSQISKLEALLNLPKLFFKKKDGLTIRQYYSAVLGKRNYNNVLFHALNAVPSQNTENFPADMLFKKRERRKDILRKFTLSGGLETFIKQVIEKSGFTTLTGTTVEKITRAPNSWLLSLKTPDGSKEISCGSLALAVPPDQAARLLQDCLPDLAGRLAQIVMKSVESLAVVYKKEQVNVDSVAGIIATGDLFYSAVSRDIINHDTCRGFTFHFEAGVKDHSEKMNIIRQALAITEGSEPVYTTEKINRVPSFQIGHKKLIDDIQADLAGSGLLLSGNYFEGMAIEDCVQRSKAEAERLMQISRQAP